MAKAKTPLQLAREFREALPRTTPLERLQWLRKQLGIDEDRVILLLGRSPDETTVEDAVRDNPDAAIYVVELFLDLANLFNYDTKRLTTELRKPIDIAELGVIPPDILLKQIIAGGPGVLLQLMKFLRLPEVGNLVKR